MSPKVAAGYVLHIGEVSGGGSSVKVGDIVRASVDYVRRTRIMPNHTFTHVLNYALRCTTHPWCTLCMSSF